ncbi:MAG: glycosyltransferase [candidate division Zixibacteria bacterium]|nr:glycosyltransferase [candidate division Zixibacteria bacterium]
MEKKINVLHIINELELGGAEILLVDISKHYDRSKFNLYVLYLYGQGSLGSNIEENGVTVELAKGGRQNPILCFFSIIKCIKRWNIDIVHTHLILASILGRIAGKLIGTKILLSTRHYGKNVSRNALRFRFDRLTSNLADKIVAVSKCTAEYISQNEKYHNQDIAVIYNGVDLELIDCTRLKYEMHSEKTTIGTISSLREQKRPDRFIRVCAEVAKQFPSAYFEIIGSGPLLEKLKKLSSGLGIENRIKFLNSVSRDTAVRILNQWKIFILTSQWESFGIVIAEAMAMELPVVASNVGGIPEIVREGIDGFLLEPEDVEGFATKIKFLIDNPQKTVEMGKSGRERIVKNFSVLKMVKEYEQLYTELLESKNRK